MAWTAPPGVCLAFYLALSAPDSNREAALEWRCDGGQRIELAKRPVFDPVVLGLECGGYAKGDCLAGSCSGSLQCPLSRLDELLGSFYVSVRRFNTLVPFGGSFWAAGPPIGGT